MKQRKMGRTGMVVSELCLGTMTFAGQCDEATSVAIMDSAAEVGVTFIDTADIYPLPADPDTAGRTEEVVGRWLANGNRRQRFILATKCRMRVGHGPNDEGLSRRHILSACDASLRRLKTDVIDLFYAHSPDPQTPIDETLRAFDDLARAGKVRYVGCSNFPSWQVALSLGVSDRSGLARFDCVQPRYNLLYREAETELLPLCRDQGIGVAIYNPIAGGMLSGKHQKALGPTPGTRFTLGTAGELYRDRYWQDAQFDAVSGLKAYFDTREIPLARAAVSWALARDGISSVIIGASHPHQLTNTLSAVELTLDDEARAVCDAVWWNLPRRP